MIATLLALAIGYQSPTPYPEVNEPSLFLESEVRWQKFTSSIDVPVAIDVEQLYISPVEGFEVTPLPPSWLAEWATINAREVKSKGSGLVVARAGPEPNVFGVPRASKNYVWLATLSPESRRSLMRQSMPIGAMDSSGLTIAKQLGSENPAGIGAFANSLEDFQIGTGFTITFSGRDRNGDRVLTEVHNRSERNDAVQPVRLSLRSVPETVPILADEQVIEFAEGGELLSLYEIAVRLSSEHDTLLSADPRLWYRNVFVKGKWTRSDFVEAILDFSDTKRGTFYDLNDIARKVSEAKSLLFEEFMDEWGIPADICAAALSGDSVSVERLLKIWPELERQVGSDGYGSMLDRTGSLKITFDFRLDLIGNGTYSQTDSNGRTMSVTNGSSVGLNILPPRP